jgi:hypothetical protein
MTTEQLIEELKRLDPSGKLEVIYKCWSDYRDLDDGDVKVVDGVRKSSCCYIMRSHQTMPPEDVANCRTYVCFPGN